MSLLNSEQTQAVFAKLQATNAPQEAPNPAPAATPVQNQEVKQETNTSAPSSPEPKADKSVPYDRFKEVNDKRKEYHQQLESQRQELERLKQELESKSSRSRSDDDDSWLDSLFSGDDYEEEKPTKKSNQSDDKYSSLEKRLQTFEMKEAERELDSIVSNAKKYNKDINPDLLETVIYKSIAENPYVDVNDVVDNLREFIGFVKTDGVRQQPVVQQPQQRLEAAPRPSMQGNKTYSSEGIKKPSTVSEAREALYQYLKTNKL